MKILSNNCRIGNIAVSPSNWNNSNADFKKEWCIIYWFYDDNLNKKKQIRRRGMNGAETLKLKQDITKKILEEELFDLVNLGYNPITNVYHNKKVNSVSENTPFFSALEFAVTKIKCSHRHEVDLRSNMNFIKSAIENQDLNKIKICDIRLRHIHFIMDWFADHKKIWNDNQYNVYRTTLIRLFSILENYEVVLNNFPKKLEKKYIAQKIRKTLTEEECSTVYNFLKENYYSFWRLFMIFFQSGCRMAELLRVKVKDVDLINSEFKMTIKKGRIEKEEIRAITQDAAPFWKEVFSLSKSSEEYVFSYGLIPGIKPNTSSQITKRWYKHVKGKKKQNTPKLNIEADFYSLKHLFLDKVAESVSIEAAQLAAGHTSSKTTRIYTVNEKRREIEKTKNLKISFIKMPKLG